jgi:fibronectin type 3 domain-containing protein
VVALAARVSIEDLENRWMLAGDAYSVNFIGNNGTGSPFPLAAAEQAGVVKRGNFNNLAGANGTGVELVDNTGVKAPTPVTVDWSSAGMWASEYNNGYVPGNPDHKLNNGFLHSDNANNVPVSVTLNNIPFATYDVYAYVMNDGANRLTTTTANGQSYVMTSANPNDGQHMTNPNGFKYTRGTGTDAASATPSGTYVLFTGQTGGSFTFTTDAVGNGALNGFQVIESKVAPATAPVIAAPTTASNLVILNWNDVGPGVDYEVFRSDTVDPIARVAGTTFRDTTVTNGTQYTYRVRAVNGIGNGPLSAPQNATPQNAAPVAPTLSGAYTGGQSVGLSWNAVPFAESYDVFRSDTAGGALTQVGTAVTGTNFTDTVPTNNESYYYTVRAVNAGGSSPASNQLPVFVGTGFNSVGVNFVGGRGGQPNYAMAPTDVAGVYAEDNFNNATGGSGTNVPLVDANGNATPMRLTYTSGGTYASRDGAVVPANGDQKLNHGFIYGNANVTVSNIPFSRYYVYVYELNDAAGRVETTTANGLSYYGASADPNNLITGTDQPYTYTQTVSTNQAAPTVGGNWVLYVGTSPTFNFTTSAPGNGYLNGFQIVNAPLGAPAAPVLAAPTISSNTVVLNWTGQDATSYTVFRGVGAGAPVAVATDLTATTYTDTSVTNGTQYTYYVVANNPFGPSANSNTRVATPQPQAPAAPMLVAANVGGSNVQLNWSAPAFATSYTVSRSSTQNGTYDVLASGLTAPTYVDATATAGQTFFYRVTASNTGGTSGASNTAFAGPGLTALSVNFVGGRANEANYSMAPTDVAGVYPQGSFNNATGANATNVPLVDSNGNATGALLTYTSGGTYASRDGSVVPATADQKLNHGFIYGNSNVTVTNIPYANYDVYVYMLNDGAGRVQTTTSGGISYYSASPNPADPNYVSGAPNTYQYTQAVSTDPANPTAGGNWVLFPGQTGSSFNFQTSAPGNGYLNGFMIVNHPVAAPTAPTLAAPASNNQQAVLTWTASPAATSYTVFRSSGGGAAVAVASNLTGTTYSDTGLTNGTQYTYYVVANNPLGSSPASNSQVVTPAAVATGAPTQLVAARTSPTAVNVSWAPVQFAQSYSVARSTTLNGSYLPVASGLTSPTFTDTNAPSAGNQGYFYRVTATNVGGTSPASQSVYVGYGTGFAGYYYGSAANDTVIQTGDAAGAVLNFGRLDPVINFVGGAAVPPPGAPANWNQVQGTTPGEHWAARWVGYVSAPVTGYYTLFPSSDDGVGVTVYDPTDNTPVQQPPYNIGLGRGLAEDSVKVVDKFGQPMLWEAGKRYLVQLDYNQGGGDWGVALRYGASSTTANRDAGTLDAMAKQLIQGYNVNAPAPEFRTVSAAGEQAKDQAYYTLTSSGLELEWGNLAGADSYNVYRYSGNDPSNLAAYVKVNASPVLATAGIKASYIDADPALTSGQTYYYLVTAVNSLGETPRALGLQTSTTPQLIEGTSGTNYIYVTNDPADPSQVQWWVRGTPFTTSPVGTTPTGTASSSGLNGALNILGKGGTDHVTLDFTNGFFVQDPTVGVTFANNTAGNTLRVIGTTGDDVLRVDQNRRSLDGLGTSMTVGGTAVALNIAGVSSFEFPGGGGGADQINVTTGDVTVDAGAPAAGEPATAVTVAAGATATFTKAQNLASLTINGGTVKVSTATGVTVNAPTVAVTGGGRLDLGRNTLVTTTAAATIAGLLKTGSANGAWNGAGINSSTAAAAGGSRAVGWRDDGGTVTVKYTLAGDGNLDGTVDFNDLVPLAQNYEVADGARTWAQGDFTYDGNVDFNDLVKLAQNYETSLSPTGAAVAFGPGFTDAAFAEAKKAAAVGPVTAPAPAPVTTKPVAPRPVAKPVAPAKPAAKPVVAVKPAASPKAVTPFASKTQLATAGRASGAGDVLQKVAAKKSLFR